MAAQDSASGRSVGDAGWHHHRPAWALVARVTMLSLPLMVARPGLAQTMTPAITPSAVQAIPASAVLIRSLQLNSLNPQEELDVSGYKLKVESLQPYLATFQDRINKLQTLGPLLQTVQAPSSQINQYNDGIRINTRYSYQLKPTACLAQAAVLANAGVACGTTDDLQKRLTSFADPGSRNYVSDPGLRAQAINNLKTVNADLINKAPSLRAALDQPQTKLNWEMPRLSDSRNWMIRAC